MRGKAQAQVALGFVAFLRSTREHSSAVSCTLRARQAPQGPGPSEKGPRLRRSEAQGRGPQGLSQVRICLGLVRESDAEREG